MAALDMIALGRRLHNAYADLTKPLCKKYGVNGTCFDVLLFFANNPQYTSAKDAYTVRGIKSGLASVAIESLLRQRLLTRSADERDKRFKRLTPTEKAAPLIEEGRRMQQAFWDALRQDVTNEELAALDTATRKLSDNLDRLENCGRKRG